MFPVFRSEKGHKSPPSDFAIFQGKPGHGGFRGHSQPVNDVVREAGGIAKRTLEKIAHSYACPGLKALALALPSFSRHGND